MTWSQLLRSHAAVACDFVTIDTALLQPFYLLFFIDVTTREISFGGITTNPTAAWTIQAARNLLLLHGGKLADAKALVRDRGSQFTASFDEMFRTQGIQVLTTPVRTPVAKSIAQRRISTLRRELLDRTIIRNQRHCTGSWSTHRSVQPTPASPGVSATSAVPAALLKQGEHAYSGRDPAPPPRQSHQRVMNAA